MARPLAILAYRSYFTFKSIGFKKYLAVGVVVSPKVWHDDHESLRYKQLRYTPVIVARTPVFSLRGDAVLGRLGVMTVIRNQYRIPTFAVRVRPAPQPTRGLLIQPMCRKTDTKRILARPQSLRPVSMKRHDSLCEARQST